MMGEVEILEAVPDGLFSANYTVYQGTREVARIQPRLFSIHYKGTLTVDGEEYSVYRSGGLKGAWVLDPGSGEAMALIQRQGLLSAHFTMESAVGAFEIRCRQLSLKEHYELFHGGEKVGTFGLKKWFSRRLMLTTSIAIPLVIRIYLIWFLLVQVQSNNSATA